MDRGPDATDRPKEPTAGGSLVGSASIVSRIPAVARDVALILALAPMLIQLWRARTVSWPAYLDGDLALVELGVRQTLRLAQPLGLYSRFGWSHPGPAMFEALAPFYLVSGESSGALFVGALILNLLAAATALWLLRRRAGTGPALLGAMALFVLQLELGEVRLANPWPPFLVVLPFFLFTVLAGLTLARKLRGTWPLLLLGSVLVQTHLGVLPGVACLGGAALIGVRRQLPCAVDRTTRGSLSTAIAVTLFLALWVPPLWNEVRAIALPNDRGNALPLLATFLHSPEPSVGWRAGWGLISGKGNEALNFWLGILRIDRPLAALGLPTAFRGSTGVAVLGAILLLGLGRGLRRRDDPALPWVIVGLASTFAALLAAISIVGPPLEYLVTWSLAALAVSIATAVGLALPRPPRPEQHPGLRIVLLGGLLGVFTLGAHDSWSAPENRRFVPESSADVAVLTASVAAVSTVSSTCVRLGTWNDAWLPVAGVVLDLHKDHFPVRVHPRLSWMFGRALAAGGGRCREIRAAGPGVAWERWPQECRRELTSSPRATLIELLRDSPACSARIADELTHGFW